MRLTTLFPRLALVAALAAAGEARAADWELTAWIGPAFPFYEQTFEYDPGPIDLGIPGTQLQQRGNFTLDARGGVAAGGALALNFSPHAGLELRLDTADVHVRTQGARYTATVRLPPPLPPVLQRDLDLGTGDVDVERVRPISLNLRVRSSGRLRAVASAGGSYIPSFRLVARQAIAVDLPDIGPIPLPDTAANIALAAEALPEDEGEGRFGVNAGGGLQYQMSPRLALTVEGRYFWFQQQTLTWGVAVPDLPLPPLEDALIRQIEAGLEPAKFNPTFFQATAGVSITF